MRFVVLLEPEATSRLGLDYILDAIKNVRMAE